MNQQQLIQVLVNIGCNLPFFFALVLLLVVAVNAYRVDKRRKLLLAAACVWPAICMTRLLFYSLLLQILIEQGIEPGLLLTSSNILFAFLDAFVISLIAADLWSNTLETKSKSREQPPSGIAEQNIDIIT